MFNFRCSCAYGAAEREFLALDLILCAFTVKDGKLTGSLTADLFNIYMLNILLVQSMDKLQKFHILDDK